ncbi:MAG: NUDIX hydrolase [Acidimicrobiia bacterium]|nr:NUDIX hydrolase [Acidimicrobiia bacterium]
MTPPRSELLRLLTAYDPLEPDEQRYRRQMLDAAAVTVDPFDRGEYVPGHFTASAFIIHPDGDRVLLIHHGKIGIWVQPGGHVDPGDPGLIEAAMREVAEETGVADLTPIGDGLFDIDIHEYPESPEQSRHLHFDLRFGFVAGSGVLAATEEVKDCRWVRLDELESLGVGRSVTRPVSRLLGYL